MNRPFAPRRLYSSCFKWSCLVVGLGLTPTHGADLAAPAKNWVLPLFTKEGYRLMTARGSEARAVSKDQFDVIDLNLTLFSSDAAMRVDTILLSPASTFQPEELIARGDNGVRFIREDVEASGRRWVYQQKEKKISLDGNVSVIFHAELKALF